MMTVRKSSFHFSYEILQNVDVEYFKTAHDPCKTLRLSTIIRN